MNCKHPTLYVLGPENKPAPYGYCMLCEVARLTADIATLERRERSRNNRIAELEDALRALDARKEGDNVHAEAVAYSMYSGWRQQEDVVDAFKAGAAWASPASRDGRQGEWVPWKPGDALPAPGIYPCTIDIASHMYSNPHEWLVACDKDRWYGLNNHIVTAYLPVRLPPPYAPAATAEQGGEAL